MAEFVERNFEEGNFYGRKNPNLVFDGDVLAAKKREINRKRIEDQQGVPMSSVVESFNEHLELHDNRPKRRTRGKGRKINYKLP